MNFELLGKIQIEVGQWSGKNFGTQTSKHTSYPLGSTAAVLGLQEEVGEFMAAATVGDMRDAIGDTLVYLCDWASREGLRVADYVSATYPIPGMIDGIFWTDGNDADKLLAIGVAAISHATLKRHQGIRGFDDPELYRARVARAIDVVVHACRRLCLQWFGVDDPVQVLEETWNGVKRRDWTVNKKTGGENIGPADTEVAAAPLQG